MKIQRNKSYYGDCLELMPYIESKSIDLILCDLPYGTTKCKWDNIIPFEPLWKEYKRIIKEHGPIVLFSSQPFTTKLISSNFKEFKYCWTWDKTFGRGHLVVKYRPMQQTEDICVFGKGRLNYYPIKTKRGKPVKSVEGPRTTIMGGKKSDLYVGRIRHERQPTTLLKFKPPARNSRLHPVQKPILLLEYLIKTHTKEGSIVLDNCAGSGSTAIACLNTNRNYVLIENNLDYYNVINERIKSWAMKS